MGYCSKCGQKFDNGAVFCSRCGTKVSSSGGSGSGNSSGFIHITRGKSFPVTSQASVRFSTEMDNFVKIRAPFEREGRQKNLKFIEYINTKSGGFDWLYHAALSEYSHSISDTLGGLGLKTLLDNGVNWYSPDMLSDGFADFIQGSTGDKQFQQFLAYNESLVNLVESIARKRNIQRSSRSYWQGGGFGIKGAICGKIKADMMNLGTNALRSIGDSIVDSRDRAQIDDYMNRNYSNAGNQLTRSHYNLLCDVGVYIYCILVEEGKLNPVDFLKSGQLKSEEAMGERSGAKIDNIYNGFCSGGYTKEQAVKSLCECISEYPFHLYAYRDIYKIDRSTKANLIKLEDYCGNTYGFMTWVSDIDNGLF